MNQQENPSFLSKVKAWIKRHPIITTLIVLFIIGIASSPSNEELTEKRLASENSHTSQKEEATKVEAIKISSESLRLVYKANEVNADNMYRGKLVEVTGIIDDIGKDISNDSYVTFKGPEYELEKIQCYFSSKEEGSLVSLKSGQNITVQGTVSGGSIFNIIIKNCRIL